MSGNAQNIVLNTWRGPSKRFAFIEKVKGMEQILQDELVTGVTEALRQSGRSPSWEEAMVLTSKMSPDFCNRRSVKEETGSTWATISTASCRSCRSESRGGCASAAPESLPWTWKPM